jgi:hypothetical protein
MVEAESVPIKEDDRYIECLECQSFSIEDRILRKCRRCKNSRWIENPKYMLCNLCGDSLCYAANLSNPPYEGYGAQTPFGLYNAKVMGGYESFHLLDMNEYTFSLCEHCLRKLFMQCKIPPKVQYSDNSDHPSKYGFAQDQEYYEFRVWENDGGCHQAYLNGKCNRVKNCPNDAIYTRLHNDDQFTENCMCEEHKETFGYSNSKLVKFIPNSLKAFI